MRLSDIKTILHAEVLWGEEHLDREVFPPAAATS